MQKKYSTYGIAILSIVYIIFGILTHFLVARIVDTNFKKDLTNSVDVSLAAINPEDIANLSVSHTDLTSPDYVQLKAQLMKLQSVYAKEGLDSLYLVRKKAERTYFLADSLEPSHARYSAPGELYREPPLELAGVFETGDPAFTDVYTDEYGTFLTYIKPVLAADGTIVAAMSADIDYSVYKNKMFSSGIYHISSVILLYILSITTFFYIQKRKQATSERQESQQKLDAITNAALDAIVMVDANGTIAFWNKAAERLFGHVQAEVVGKDFNTTTSFHDKPALTAKSPVIGTVFDAKIVNSQGVELTIEMSTASIIIENKTFAVCMIRDISKRKKQEEEIEVQKENLEKTNKFMVGRELRMDALKKEIEKLKSILVLNKIDF